MRIARMPVALATAVAALALAPAAHAVVEQDDQVVASKRDRIPIVYKTFLPDGASAEAPVPAVLMTHGWGGTRSRTYGGFVRQLVEAGYAVLTWDQRGFGQSGGVANVDDPRIEAVDVETLVDVLAADPRIAQDAPGDPQVGMAGGSYAGGIQFVTAARDRRVDAIAPEIAWNNLLESLIPHGVVKIGWGAILYAGGMTALTNGLSPSSPAGPQAGAYHEMIHRAFAEGGGAGEWSPEVRGWFASKGPDFLLDDIRAATFIVQAGTDALFPPSQAVDNFRTLAGGSDGPALKMAWYCGGHGTCTPFTDDTTGLVRRRVIAWFDRWVRDRDSVDTGPRFEYLTDDGVWNSASDYPVPGTQTRLGSGRGVLTVNGEPVQSGILGATTARSSVKAPIDAGSGTAIGAPVVKMRVRALGSSPDAPLRVPIFLQVVEQESGRVVGNQVTPTVVVADGTARDHEVELEPVAYRVGPGRRLALEVVGTAAGFEPYRGAAVVDLQSIAVELPVLP
jgi:ABC-2 type transport system ATP-binding protein